MDNQYYKLVDKTNVLPSKKMVFAPGKNSREIEALKLFAEMQPEARTELLGGMFERWYNDQQVELARVSGDY